MAATNASGTTTVRYGGMRAHVLALEVVLADGRVVRTGTRAVKTSAGYNLTNLFVGSEGTLGVITELTLRLHPIPDHIVVARAAFPSVEAACRAAAAIIGAGVLVTRCELLDAMTIAALNAYKGTTFPESPYLFVEFGGSEAASPAISRPRASSPRTRARPRSSRESDPTARARMWDARHNALHRVARARARLAGDDDRRRRAGVGARRRDRARARARSTSRGCAAASSATSATATSTSRSSSIPTTRSRSRARRR